MLSKEIAKHAACFMWRFFVVAFAVFIGSFAVLGPIAQLLMPSGSPAELTFFGALFFNMLVLGFIYSVFVFSLQWFVYSVQGKKSREAHQNELSKSTSSKKLL